MPEFLSPMTNSCPLRSHAFVSKIMFHMAASSVTISSVEAFPDPGQASVALVFADGTRLQAEYWRLIEDGRAGVSSFDHQQKYGLPVVIDAVQELQHKLASRMVVEALHDRETGDLLLKFTGNVKLQIWNVTGYEIWEIRFPDGTGEYSNYAK